MLGPPLSYPEHLHVACEVSVSALQTCFVIFAKGWSGESPDCCVEDMCWFLELHGTLLGGHRSPGDKRDIRRALTSFATRPGVPCPCKEGVGTLEGKRGLAFQIWMKCDYWGQRMASGSGGFVLL